MSADPRTAPLLPRAQALQSRIDQQLSQPAALLVPPGVRTAVRELGDLVAVLAARVDTLTTKETP
jgi:hypothetical protein